MVTTCLAKVDTLQEALMARARAGGETVWLTAAELADRLRVAQSTLWQWNLRGYGPRPVRIGGKLRYRVEAVEAWEREQEALTRAR
jgi:predicted DNA-binding transcriptional regulator AlpA